MFSSHTRLPLFHPPRRSMKKYPRRQLTKQKSSSQRSRPSQAWSLGGPAGARAGSLSRKTAQPAPRWVRTVSPGSSQAAAPAPAPAPAQGPAQPLLLPPRSRTTHSRSRIVPFIGPAPLLHRPGRGTGRFSEGPLCSALLRPRPRTARAGSGEKEDGTRGRGENNGAGVGRVQLKENSKREKDPFPFPGPPSERKGPIALGSVTPPTEGKRKRALVSRVGLSSLGR